MSRNVADELKLVQALKPDARAAGTYTSNAIDVAGFDELIVELNAGDLAATSTLNVKLQECATSNGQFADVGSAVFDQVDKDNDDAIYKMRVAITPTRQRYVKVVAVLANDAADFAVTAMLTRGQQQPAQAADVDVYS